MTSFGTEEGLRIEQDNYYSSDTNVCKFKNNKFKNNVLVFEQYKHDLNMCVLIANPDNSDNFNKQARILAVR